MLFPTLCLVSLTVAAAAEKSPYETARYTAHRAPVASVVFAPGGEALSAGEDGSVRRWDIKTLQDRGEKAIRPFKKPTQVAISPRGDLIAVAGDEEEFYFGVRDYPTASVFNHLEEVVLSSVSFSPDGKWLAVGGIGNVTIWDTSKSNVDGTFSTSFSDKKLDLPPSCLAEYLVFAPDSKVLITLGRAGPEFTMQMWDAQSGKMFSQRPADGPALAVAPNSQSAITGREIWKFAKGQPPVHLNASHALTAAIYSPDSKWIATGGSDNRLSFWDSQTGKLSAIVRAHDDAITSVALSRDGRQLLSGSRDGTARLWDVTKILSEKPLEQPLAKLAKYPKAYDAWRLGLCYTKAIIAYDPTKPKLANLDEAEKRAAALGIKLPMLPATTELPVKVEVLSQNQEQLSQQVIAQVGETEGKLFLTGLTLPMLQLVIEAEGQSVTDFGEKLFPEMVQELVKEFGLLPVMFNRLQGAIDNDALPEVVAEHFDQLMREIDLNLEALAGPKKPAS